MECTENFEGTVTNINSSLAYFVVEGNLKVHMSVIMAQNKAQGLPVPGTKVLIKKCHRMGVNYVVCSSSTLEGQFTFECPNNPFLNLVTVFKLGPLDLFKFEEIGGEIEKNFTTLNMDLKMDILLSLLHNIISLMDKNETAMATNESCGTSIISKYSLATIRTCKYVEIRSNKYVNFPYWSLGVHPSKNGRVLFGYLEIHQHYGFFMIKDSHYQMPCVVITDDSKRNDIEVPELNNSFVLLEKYTVVTEIFNVSEIPNLEYLIVDIDDINVIHSTKKNNTFIGTEPECLRFANVISFVVLKKSTVCIGPIKSPELLLQVKIRFKFANLVWKEVFLVLPSSYIAVNLNFTEGSLYMMYYITELKTLTNPELTRMKQLKIYEVPQQDCYFRLVNAKMCDVPKPLTISECKHHIESKNDLVSFRGIVTSKRFTDPLSSRTTTRKSTLYGFGTPGSKVHQIVFSQSDDSSKVFLDCYLNNWENMLMPLGLVPQMEVIVKNVYPQSKKYLKSTIFTTFEVVSYQPMIRFSTVNLYENDSEDWGVPFCLSQGHKLPVGVLVWGKVYTIFLLKLSITVRCVQCKVLTQEAVFCQGCKGEEREVEFMAKFNASDQCGQSLITTSSTSILRVLLNLKPTEFEEWLTNFKRMGSFHYNYFNEETTTRDVFSNYLANIGEKLIFLELKCRKLPSSRPGTEQRPSWNCIDARKR